MRVRTLLIFLIALTGFGLQAQNVGIDVVNPKTRLDVNGDLRIGKHSTSSPYLAGRIIYEPTGRIFEGHDSTAWKPLQSLWTRATNYNVYRPLGNVGINWANPNGQFGIKSAGSGVINIEVNRDLAGPILMATDLNDPLNPFLIDLDIDDYGQAYARFAISADYPNQMTVQRNGKIGFGTNMTGNYTGLESAMVEFADNDATHSDWALRLGSNEDNGWPSILFGKSKGTTVAPTAITDNHRIGEFQFLGYDGQKFVSAATIKAEVDGTSGNDDMPGRLIFETKLDNSSTAAPVERMRITNEGYVGIGTSAPEGILDVRGGTALSGHGTHINIYSENGYASGNTNGGNIYLMPGSKSGTGTEGRTGISTTNPHSMLDIEGSYATAIRSVSSSTTLTASDYTVIVTGSSAVTITLPLAGTATGRIYVIKRMGTAVVSVSCSSYIDANTTYSLSTQYSTVAVQSNGTRWYIMATK